MGLLLHDPSFEKYLEENLVAMDDGGRLRPKLRSGARYSRGDDA